MAQERNIATQTQLETVNLALSVLSDNLAAHANTDLSDAHGINLVFGPLNDGQGNNLSVYADAANNLVGSFQISFVIGGTRVFVPANLTVLAGKDPTTGLTASTVLDPQSGAGESTWVTQFDDAFTALIRGVVDTYLLPHTLSGYWEAHGDTVLVNPELAHKGVSGSGSAAGWFDTALHKVARSSIKLNVDGLQLRIPCETRLGGPPQTPLVSMVPPSIYSGGDFFYTFTPTISGGTQPMTFAWEYFNTSGNVWLALPSGNPGSIFNVPFFNHPSSGVGCQQLSTSTGQLKVYNGAPGGNDYDICRLRLTATNSAGSTNVNPSGQPLIFEIQVQDSAPCCWFCTEANKTVRLSKEQWFVIGQVEQELFRQCRRMVAWYVKQGDTLVTRMLANGVPPSFFEDFTQTVLTKRFEESLEEAGRYYVQTVIEATRVHWPDCHARGYQASIRWYDQQAQLVR